MAKSKTPQAKSKPLPSTATKAASSKARLKSSGPHTLSDLRQDVNLWYKICVLIYDLRNMPKDPSCLRRLTPTIDVHYISEPYFSPDEAAAVKGALVEANTSIEDAITSSLQGFAEKRKASGDFRPCGPHDLVPVYLACFGTERAEIEDEKFVSRLRRSGLGT
jgi:hypothetical protein